MNLNEFVPIPEYPEYLVSPKGDVWSTKNDRLLTNQLSSRVYYQTCLFSGGKKRHLSISRIVASAFLGMNLYDDSVEVDHIDTDTTNNHYSNLQVLTVEEHRRKTFEDKGIKPTLSCLGCGVKLRARNETYESQTCKSCQTKEKDLTEQEICSLLSEHGSWSKASKAVGISDNGLRKMYKRVSGGKNPKYINKSVEVEPLLM